MAVGAADLALKRIARCVEGLLRGVARIHLRASRRTVETTLFACVSINAERVVRRLATKSRRPSRLSVMPRGFIQRNARHDIVPLAERSCANPPGSGNVLHQTRKMITVTRVCEPPLNIDTRLVGSIGETR